MSIEDRYENSIISKWFVDDNETPYAKLMVEQQQVSSDKNLVQLTGTPESYHGVTIVNGTDMIEVDNLDDVYINERNYYISKDGLVYFHPSLKGKTLEFKYHSLGVTLLSSNRIFYKDKDNIIRILQELIDKGYEGLRALELFGDSVTILKRLEKDIEVGTSLHENLSNDIEIGTPLQINLRKDINEANTFRTQLNKDVATGVAIKDELRQNTISAVNANTELIASNNLASSNINLLTKAGNYIGTITSSQWTGTEGNYGYSIKHDLNSEAIVINVIDVSTKEPLQPTCVFVDKNNILLKSDTKREVKVVLSASYYSGGIDSKLEIIDARKGKESLKAKIDDIDTSIVNLKDYLNYMPINGGSFDEVDGNDKTNVLIDGGVY